MDVVWPNQFKPIETGLSGSVNGAQDLYQPYMSLMITFTGNRTVNIAVKHC